MFDAIVLAGGRARRLGGVDKGAVVVGGRTLLAAALAALAAANRVIVVGPARSLPPGVVGTSEQPAGGGPVAGLAAGLVLVEAPLVVVLACDLPFVTQRTVQALLDAGAGADSTPDCDGAQLVDDEGRPQPLAAVYRTARLRAAVAALDRLAGTAMRQVVGQFRMVDVATAPWHAWDCDTWADVGRARDHANHAPGEGP